MNTSAPCAHCEGFGWSPVGQEPGWYGRDWRLLLDPTVHWQRCPVCAPPAADLLRMHEALAAVLVQRAIAEAGPGVPVGGWRCGRIDDHVVWFREGLAVVAPGPISGDGWMLFSAHGVLRDLSLQACNHHLERAGSPPLPAH